MVDDPAEREKEGGICALKKKEKRAVSQNQKKAYERCKWGKENGLFSLEKTPRKGKRDRRKQHVKRGIIDRSQTRHIFDQAPWGAISEEARR